MVKKMALIAIVLGLLAGLLPTNAQDTLPEGCTADALTLVMGAIQAANDVAGKAIKAGDLKSAIEALDTIKTDAITLDSFCGELSWSGKAASVIGPVTIPEGVYRAIATTTGFITVKITATDGECGEGDPDYLRPTLFNLSEGAADSGAQAVLTSKECTALIQISNVQTDWALVFEKVE